MRKSWRLNGVGESYQIVRRSDVAAGERGDLCTQVASLYIDRWLSDPDAKLVLLEMYGRISGHAGDVAARMRGLELHRYIKPVLLQAFRRGDYVLVRVRHETVIPIKEEEQQPVEQEQAAEEPAKKKSWIEIEMVDEEGNPVSGVCFTLEFADGSNRTGRLGSNGRARLGEIDQGTCKVSFPDLDADDWEVTSH